MKIYGWEEQNEACWGVRCREYVPSESMKYGENGLLCCCPCLPDGEWYRTCTQAKRACLILWRRKKKIACRAIRDIYATTKGMVDG